MHTLFKYRHIIVFSCIMLCALCTITSCKDEKAEALNKLMTEIRDDFKAERDSDCLAAIDSLRARFPKAVKERKEALELFQKSSLRIAQRDLAKTDLALEAAKSKFQQMQQTVNAHKAAGIATAKELTDLTLQRMNRDSLQVHFDMLCAKIKYIHKRQKQL